MNQAYIERIYDSIPSSQRTSILRGKIQGSIAGFRSPDMAPAAVLKATLKRSSNFAAQFLEAVAETFGCPVALESAEELPELTEENFWGHFAWRCCKLDDTQASSDILGEMLRTHDGRAAPEPSAQPPEPELDSGYTQYIGYIADQYRFRPVYAVRDGQLESVAYSDWLKEELPDLGNVYLHSAYRDYLKKHYDYGEIYVILLSRGDLRDNRRPDGTFYPTRYRIDVNQLESQKRILRLNDVGIYPVLQSKGRIDFSKKTILLENSDVDTDDRSLIEEDGVLYGPFTVRRAEDGQALVDLPANYVVDCYRPRSGAINYIEISINLQDAAHTVTYNTRLGDDFIRETTDKITDQDLLRAFLRFSASRKGSASGGLSLSAADEYAQDAFRGLPPEIVRGRVERIKTFLTDQLQQEELQEDVAAFTADLLYSFGESEYFAKVLDKILDDKDLSLRIQSFQIVQQRVDSKQKEYAELQAQCAQAEEKRRAAEANAERQVSELAERTSAEVRQLTAQKGELQQEIDELKKRKNGWEKLVDLEHESEVLEGVNERLREKGKQAAEALQKKLTQTAANAVDAAFDGKIADQIFRAAAGWNRQDQEEALRKIASELTDPARAEAFSQEELVDYLLSSVRRYRSYARNDILNLFICLTQNFLTIFSGEPGTGKTSICNIIAHVLGASRVSSLVPARDGILTDRYVPISVERGWTSKRDLIGYYNPLSQSFEQANKHLYDGLRILDAEGARSQYPFLVLLDEANLSSIEYYWADFMNLCDSGSPVNSITLGGDIQMRIPPTLRFAATINSDDTTERLSPRLLDRSALIQLPDAPYRQIEDEDLVDTSFVRTVPWGALQQTFSDRDEMDETSKMIYADICGQLRRELRIGVSPRVDRAIQRYWAAGKKWFESESGVDQSVVALDRAVAQRLLPKISGSGSAYQEKLAQLREICEKNNLVKCALMLKAIVDRGADAMDYYQYF